MDFYTVYSGLLFIFPALISNLVTSYSIEKHILDSAKSAEMFDLFHVMPDDMMKVIQEMDMILSLDQYKQLYMDHSHSPRHRRKAAADITTRWTDCKVYYEITESLNTFYDKKIIKEAIAEWEKFSCLRFFENEKAPRRIQFTDGDNCASAVGMQKDVQELVLASGCRTRGIIAHEIGHAIGWFHEHMRPDRDDFIRIDFNKIPDKYKIHYRKYSSKIINTYGIPYDYESIMHYGDSAFPGSMKAILTKYQDKLGQREGFSFKDIKFANVMYKCAEAMNCPKKDCGDGFQFYKRYKGSARCQCWCDSGNTIDPLILCSQRKVTIAPPPVTLPPSTAEPGMDCMDVMANCKALKAKMKCMTKMALMKSNCAKTCGFCGKGKDLCMDYEAGCGVMAGHCDDPGMRSTMSEICMASCDLCPRPPDPCEMHKEMLGDHPVAGNGNGSATLTPGGVVSVLVYVGAMVISIVLIGS